MESCHQPLDGGCVSESYISQECEQRSSWKYSKKMAARMAKALHLNRNEINLGRCLILFPFARNVASFLSKPLVQPTQTSYAGMWKCPIPLNVHMFLKLNFKGSCGSTYFTGLRTQLDTPLKKREHCSEIQDLNGLKDEPSLKKEPMNGNGYRGPEFFNRDENEIMLKIKWLAQFFSDLTISRIRHTGGLG